MKNEKTQKERFLELKNYDEYKARIAEFDGMKIDAEIIEHINAIFANIEAYAPEGVHCDVRIGKSKK